MVDLNKPLEIAEDIFWVGYVVPNDPFQCHVYLIRNGDESILIDPGSMITFPVVLEKIFQVTPLRNIKYIIFHHQDPDIVGCYATLEQLFPRDRLRFVVTHWRTKTLLKHYMWKSPFYLVDKHDWKLKAGDRELEFVFTPYAHFPGAFCTFDKKTKTLFSSDLFGAISDKFFLFATDDEEYYQGVELFHKHYMPSRAILNYALDKVESKNPELIAPQHGSIIKKEMIKPIISRLRTLECGLYVLDSEESDIFTLNRLDELLKQLFRSVISSSDFELISQEIFKSIKKEIPSLKEMVITGGIKERGDKLSFVLRVDDRKVTQEVIEGKFSATNYAYKERLDSENLVNGAIYIFADKLSGKQLHFLKLLFKHIKYAVAVSFERRVREAILLKEKEELEKRAITDYLTGLFNRQYLFDYLKETLKKAEEEGFPVAVALIDIDFFKRINDTYGHLTGDCVLKELAKILKGSFRESDCVARYGGEEFVVVMPHSNLENACKKMERVRQKTEETPFCEDKLKVTFSAGVTEFKPGESIESLLERADKNLYEAKKSGRNRVVCR
ncbi:oxygen-binding di-iron domain-containing protein [Thermovibrio ammonificans]